MERDPLVYKTIREIDVLTYRVLRCSVDAVTPLVPSSRTTALDGGSVDRALVTIHQMQRDGANMAAGGAPRYAGIARQKAKAD
jgi:hypothetical protein